MSCQQRQAAPGKSAREAFQSQLPTRRTASFRQKHDHQGQEHHRHVVSSLEKEGEEECCERDGGENHGMRKIKEQQSACKQASQ